MPKIYNIYDIHGFCHSFKAVKLFAIVLAITFSYLGISYRPMPGAKTFNEFPPAKM